MILFQETNGRTVMAWSLTGMVVAAAVQAMFGIDTSFALMG